MKRTKTIIIIITVIFLVSAIMTLYAFRPSEKHTVEVVQDGNVIYTFDLLDTENRTITVKSTDGKSSNTIEISDGKICISDAECPDKICVKSGFLKSDSMPLVCLPNRLIIRFSD
ncbi:MAG: NusG domain II-containing protein [Ruminococcus sp.]|nr:NusG domain II-containing protein [Ruminococcus sp.]